MASVTQRLHRWFPQKARLHAGSGMHCVTFIADYGHLGVMRGVVKGIFLLGILASSGMTLEARTGPESVAQMGGFLEGTHKIRHGVTCCHSLDDHFILDGSADMAINTLDVLLTFEIVGCGQSNSLALHRIELSKFFFVEMASRAKCVVLFQVVRDHDAPPNAMAPSKGSPPRRRGSQRRNVRIPGLPWGFWGITARVPSLCSRTEDVQMVPHCHPVALRTSRSSSHWLQPCRIETLR